MTRHISFDDRHTDGVHSRNIRRPCTHIRSCRKADGSHPLPSIISIRGRITKSRSRICGWGTVSSDAYVIVKQNVYIDEPVSVYPSCRFGFSAQPALNVLCGDKQLMRRKIRLQSHTHIQELVFRLKAPWLGLNY